MSQMPLLGNLFIQFLLLMKKETNYCQNQDQLKIEVNQFVKCLESVWCKLCKVLLELETFTHPL